MPIIDNFIDFLLSKSAVELIALLWYFFIFDFSRYILTDLFFLIYFVFLGPKERREKANASSKLFEEYPLVSILAPGKDEGRHLDKLVDSLAKQTYKNLEIIIIDDGSEDNSAEIGRKLEKENRIDLFLSNSSRGGKASAANFGLRFANGKFVVHMDCDSSLRYDAIEKIVMPFYLNKNIGGVAGDIRVRNTEDSLVSTLQGFEYFKNISLSRIINSKLNVLRIISGAYGAFRMDVLQRVGGWDVGPGLDGDLTVKIRKLSKRIWFESTAICYTHVPTKFSKLAKQRYRWSRSLVRFRMRKHTNVYSVFSKGFSWFNFFSFLENIFFNVGLNIQWWIYICFLFMFVDINELKHILVLNYLLYSMANFFQFSICCTLLRDSMKAKEKKLIGYFMFMPLYTGLYLRIVRTYAYFMEAFFRISFEDKWNPWKVSEKAKKENF